MKKTVLAAALVVASVLGGASAPVFAKDDVVSTGGQCAYKDRYNRTYFETCAGKVRYTVASPPSSLYEAAQQLGVNTQTLDDLLPMDVTGYCRANNGERVLCAEYPCMFTTDILTDQKACFLLVVEKVAGLVDTASSADTGKGIRAMGQGYAMKSDVAFFLAILEATAEPDANLIAGTKVLLQELDALQEVLATRREAADAKKS